MSLISRPVSRRTVLQGSALAAGLGLTGSQLLTAGSARAVTAPALAASTNASGLALPMLGDGMNLDRPEYYETIQARKRSGCHTVQSSDIDGDGQDELIYRSPAGIAAYRFDADTGQWLNLAAGPRWGDGAGWAEGWYYQTIQCAPLLGGGRSHVLGRGPKGLEAWSYDPTQDTWTNLEVSDPITDLLWGFPSYGSSTMQCADINGDGSAEVLARFSDGLRGWRLQSSGSWVAQPTLTAMSDAAGWIDPSFYGTIQCADVDGDGIPEVLGRDSTGLHVWKLGKDGWAEPYPVLTDLGNAAPIWTFPLYSGTIQAADIDGDGRAEILARNNDQILAWRLTASGWQLLTPGPSLPDSAGWLLPQHGLTLQTADLDGDGKAEILARGQAGIRSWSYSSNGAWQELAAGPAWSDANGWDKIHYYSTIHSARVKTSATNPNLPSTKSGKADVLLGRSSTAIETYRFQGNNSWTAASAPFPVLDATADAAVASFLNLSVGQRVRDLYTDAVPGLLEEKVDKLTPPPAPPASYSGSRAVWDATVAQLVKEMGWVIVIEGWFEDLGTFVTDIYTGEDVALDTVADKIQLPSGASDSALSVLLFLTNVAWSILGGAGGFLEEGAEEAGKAMAAGSIASGMLSSIVGLGGATGSADQLQGSVAQLKEDLANAFSAAVDSTGQVQDQIVSDYGLLAAVGGQIASGAPAWTWDPEVRSQLVTEGQRGYAISAWQALAPAAQWRWSVNIGADHWLADENRANRITYIQRQWYWAESGNDACRIYFVCQYDTTLGVSDPVLLDSAILDPLFSKVQSGSVFPLGVSPQDVVAARNGWPQLLGTLSDKYQTGCSSVPAPYDIEISAGAVGVLGAAAPAAASATGLAADLTSSGDLTLTPPRSGSGKPAKTVKAEKWRPNPLPAKGVDLAVQARLVRHPSGDVVARITTTNHGLTSAAEVEITDARLGGRAPTAQLPTRRRRVDSGRAASTHLRFNGVSGPAGKPVTLQIRVSHDAGRLNENLDLTLP